MELKRTDKVELTVEGLLKLLHAEWECGAQGGAGYANGCSPFADDPSYSPENAEGLSYDILQAGGTIKKEHKNERY